MTPDVSVIGAGNLAWHLAPALDNAGYAVREVYSRTLNHTRQLVERLYDAQPVDTLDFSSSKSKIFLICVSDDAIEQVAREIVLPEDALLVHTSGSKSRALLDYAAATRTGVFYPLQTFSKSRKLDFENIPVFVEGNSADAENILMKMGRAISRQVYRLDEQQRLALHVAAVFASNFANHLFRLAYEIMETHRLKPEWLNALIAETVNKAFEIGPENAQTGPARRGDLETLDLHMEFLKKHPELADIYRVLTQDILNRAHE